MSGPFEANHDDTDESGEPSNSELGPEIPQPESTVPESPSPPVPESPSPTVDSAGVDPNLRVLFWKLVLLYKVSILGTTLGVLLLLFETGPDIGLELLVGSLGFLGYTLYQSKRAKERIDAGEFDTPEDSLESGEKSSEHNAWNGDDGDSSASETVEGES